MPSRKAKEKRRYINPHLDKAHELQKAENDVDFNPLVDDTDEQKKDLEDLDDWVKKVITNKD